MIKWYCEDGNDNCIDIFNAKKDAKAFTERNEKVLEIHKYNYIFKNRKLKDIKHLGCVWKKPGWNGFAV